jgi:hypothetical protein
LAHRLPLLPSQSHQAPLQISPELTAIHIHKTAGGHGFGATPKLDAAAVVSTAGTNDRQSPQFCLGLLLVEGLQNLNCDFIFAVAVAKTEEFHQNVNF